MNALTLLSIDWMGLLEKLQNMSPLVGFIAAGLESFLPVLPLTGIVAMNVYAYGFWSGYVLSYLGTIVGSTMLYFAIRHLFRASVHRRAQKNQRWRSIIEKVQKKGFTPIFLLYCLPFTPSFFVSAGAALAEVDTYKFLAALITGKLVMIYILSSIGFHIEDMLDRPLKSILMLVAIAIIWLVLEKVIKIDERL
ncbi:TVP38/TMEM64 family protein [Clostridia bacterium]|nr:TVP38/TMEM64 family protein [Clostridia bacterium]